MQKKSNPKSWCFLWLDYRPEKVGCIAGVLYDKNQSPKVVKSEHAKYDIAWTSNSHCYKNWDVNLLTSHKSIGMLVL